MYNILSSRRKFSNLPSPRKVFRLKSTKRADTVHQNVTGKVRFLARKLAISRHFFRRFEIKCSSV